MTQDVTRQHNTLSITAECLDFIARSLAVMEHNGTRLCPEQVTGNMTPAQKAVVLSRLSLRRRRLRG